jgi:hypothetical protein
MATKRMSRWMEGSNINPTSDLIQSVMRIRPALSDLSRARVERATAALARRPAHQRAMRRSGGAVAKEVLRCGAGLLPHYPTAVRKVPESAQRCIHRSPRLRRGCAPGPFCIL